MRSLLTTMLLLATPLIANSATIDFTLEYAGLTERQFVNSVESGGLEFSLAGQQSFSFGEDQLSCMAISSVGIELFCGDLMISSNESRYIRMDYLHVGSSVEYNPEWLTATGDAGLTPNYFSCPGFDENHNWDPTLACTEHYFDDLLEFNIYYGGVPSIPEGLPPGCASDPGCFQFALSASGDGPFILEGVNYGLKASTVPIPAAVWLFGSALAGLGWIRRKHAA
jgi:hypothetical protein